MTKIRKKGLSILLSVILFGGVSVLMTGCLGELIIGLAVTQTHHAMNPKPLEVEYQASFEQTKEAYIKVLKELGYKISDKSPGDRKLFDVTATRGGSVPLEIAIHGDSNSSIYGYIISGESWEEEEQLHQKVLEWLKIQTK